MNTLEIREAIKIIQPAVKPPFICVIPVRMQEAWLLFDEVAIRWAAGNSHGRQALHLPKKQDIENLPDPKETLRQLLCKASGLTGRRLKKFHVSQGVHRVAEYIKDFSSLRELPAFSALEKEVREVVKQWSAD